MTDNEFLQMRFAEGGARPVLGRPLVAVRRLLARLRTLFARRSAVPGAFEAGTEQQARAVRRALLLRRRCRGANPARRGGFRCACPHASVRCPCVRLRRGSAARRS